MEEGFQPKQCKKDRAQTVELATKLTWSMGMPGTRSVVSRRGVEISGMTAGTENLAAKAGSASTRVLNRCWHFASYV